MRLFRPAEALDDFVKAIDRRPDYADAYINAGNAQKGLGRYAEAMRSFDRALALRPEDPTATWSKAVLKLALGAFRDGWPLYEARFRLPHASSLQRRFDVPRWTGAEPLEGRTLFVHSEQGLGDTLQFCRYIGLLEARGAEGRFLRFSRSSRSCCIRSTPAPRSSVRGEPLPPFDFHTPLLSLPLAFRTEADSIPGGVPYLKVDPEAAALLGRAASRVAGFQGRTELARQSRSGEAFRAASALISVERRRRAGASTRRQPRVAAEGSRRRAAQPGRIRRSAHAADRSASAWDPMKSRTKQPRSWWASTSSSPPTRLSPISPARSGFAVWVVLQAVPDWRWLTEREDSPWYPTMRLFRQRTPGDWPEVLDRVPRPSSRRRVFGGRSTTPLSRARAPCQLLTFDRSF